MAEAIAAEVLGPPGQLAVRPARRWVRWGAHNIEFVLVTHGNLRSGRTAIVAQLPLRPKALQIVVAGPSAEGGILMYDFIAFVSSVDGESNWRGGTERLRYMAGRIAIGLAAWLLIGGSLIAVATVVLSRRHRRARAAEATAPSP